MLILAINLGKWLDASLKSVDPKDDGRVLRIMSARYFCCWMQPVSRYPRKIDESISVPTPERHSVPPPLMLERFVHQAAWHIQVKRYVWIVIVEFSVDDPSFLSTLAVIRALRLTGLNADSTALAREAAALIFALPNKPEEKSEACRPKPRWR